LLRIAVLDLAGKHRRITQLQDDVPDRLRSMGALLRSHVHCCHAFETAQDRGHLSSLIASVESMMRCVSAHAERNGSTSFISAMISLISFPAPVSTCRVALTACSSEA